MPAEAVQAGQQGQFIYVVKAGQHGGASRVVTAGPGVRQEDGHREGHRARRYCGHRRPAAPLSRARRCKLVDAGETRSGEVMNLSRIFIERPVMTALVSLRHSAVRRHRLSRAAGGGAAERGLPDHPGERRRARRQSGDHGVLRGHAAGARVLHHRRHPVDELHQLAGQHVDHRAVHAGPQDRRRRAGHSGRHRARRRTPAAEHAAAAFLSKGQSGRAARLLPGARFHARCRCTRSTSMPTRCWRSASPW